MAYQNRARVNGCARPTRRGGTQRRFSAALRVLSTSESPHSPDFERNLAVERPMAEDTDGVCRNGPEPSNPPLPFRFSGSHEVVIGVYLQHFRWYLRGGKTYPRCAASLTPDLFPYPAKRVAARLSNRSPDPDQLEAHHGTGFLSGGRRQVGNYSFKERFDKYHSVLGAYSIAPYPVPSRYFGWWPVAGFYGGYRCR